MLVVATAAGVETGAAVVAAGWAVGAAVTTTAGVAGAAVATGVTCCAGVDEAHPAKNAVRTSSPQMTPMMMICLVLIDCFMVNRSIAQYFSGEM